MATKSFWQSMTGWINKPADAPAPERPSIQAESREAESAAQAEVWPAQRPGERNPHGSGAIVPADPEPSEAQIRSAASEETQPAADAPAERANENAELKNKIIDVIKTCYDPEIPVNIYELGLIYDVKVDEENNAHVKMTLTAPNCPAAQSLPAEVKYKIEAMDEINSASVEIVFDPPWNPNRMSDSAKLVLNIL
jgi:FeS assembly SUF system protein